MITASPKQEHRNSVIVIQGNQVTAVGARYDGKRVEMYQLTPDLRYVEISESRFFPILTPALLADSIELSKTVGQTDALKAFRQQIRARKP